MPALPPSLQQQLPKVDSINRGGVYFSIVRRHAAPDTYFWCGQEVGQERFYELVAQWARSGEKGKCNAR